MTVCPPQTPRLGPVMQSGLRGVVWSGQVTGNGAVVVARGIGNELHGARCYLYTGASPVNNADPAGLDFWSDLTNSAGPDIVGGAVSVFGGVVAQGLIDSTGGGLLASFAIGCGAGLVTQAASDSLTGQSNSPGTYVGHCLGGGVTALAGFGAAALVGALKP